MKVVIRYHSFLSSQIGLSQEELTLEEGISVAGFRERLGALHPEIAPFLPTVLIAVNRAYAGPNETLGAGDDISPPISGGCG